MRGLSMMGCMRDEKIKNDVGTKNRWESKWKDEWMKWLRRMMGWKDGWKNDGKIWGW